jgi:hypothetical protein
MPRLFRSIALRPIAVIALLAAFPLPAPAHAAPPAGFVALADSDLAGVTSTGLPTMPAPLDPARRVSAFEMAVSTAWDQMDAWWADDGALLILEAVRPAPDLATLPRLAFTPR